MAVDSVSADNYAIYRKSGDLDCVLGGLRKAISIKKRTGSKTLINVRMVIMKQNEHEISAIECMARDAGADVFTIKSLNPSHGVIAKDEELLPTDPQYRRYEYIPGTFERVRADAICRRVWTMSNILSNGDVVPCTYDYDSEMKVGNVFETPFTQIWNSSAYSELRKRIYHDMQAIPKCSRCGVNFMLTEYRWFVKASDLRFGNRLAISVDNPDVEITRLTDKVFQYAETLAALKGQIDAIQSSIGWKMLERLRLLRNALIPESVYLRLRKYLLRVQKKETRV